MCIIHVFSVSSDAIVNSKGLSYGYPLDNPFNKVSLPVESTLTNVYTSTLTNATFSHLIAHTHINRTTCTHVSVLYMYVVQK